ncbi:MAG: ABC transporter permease [Cyclobacteriaceae bacterium]
MFNHLKLALRHFNKRLMFSLINLFSLVVGITISFLVINYVAFENSFDLFHSDHDRTYRVESQFYKAGVLTDDWGSSSFGYGSAMRDELKGIEAMTRLAIHNTEQVVSLGDRHIRENTIAYAEANFLDVFSFNVIKGNKSTALSDPSSVMITKRIAEKFFGTTDVIGKSLEFGTTQETKRYQISAVLDNIPSNSHIKFDYFLSFESLPDWMRNFWYYHETYTYVRLSHETMPASIESAFPSLAEKYKTGEALKDLKWAIRLVPLASIHLNPQKQYEREAKGSRSVTQTLHSVGLIILLMSWINYINLTSAKSHERSAEIAFRKVSGATRASINIQFFIESGLMTIFALLLSGVAIILLHPVLNQFLEIDIPVVFFQNSAWYLPWLMIILTGASLTALYPAFTIGASPIISILKGDKLTLKGGLLRRGLVITQFAGAFALIIATTIAYKQYQFMQSRFLGIEIDQQMAIKLPVNTGSLPEKLEAFRKELKQHNAIQNVSFAGAIPGREVATFASNRRKDSNENKLYEMLAVDEEYIDAMALRMIAGRKYDKSFGGDSNKLIVNEAALGLLEIESPQQAIGQEVMIETKEYPFEIVGVLQNWHQRSLNNPFTPIMLIKNGNVPWINPRYIVLQFNGSGYSDIDQYVANIWADAFPASSFDRQFVQTFYQQQYQMNDRNNKLIATFTGLALLIAYLGLWAFTSYMTMKRMKEVSIRKVLGADNFNISVLFGKSVVTDLAIAFVIATPLVWIGMSQWLDDFAFRTQIGLLDVLIPSMILIAIALATVFFESIKPAQKNPAEVLNSQD